MSLLNFLKDRNAGKPEDIPSQAGPADDDESPELQRFGYLMGLPLQQWMTESGPEWDACDAVAPDTSATTEEVVRAVIFNYLPLNDEQSVPNLMAAISFSWWMPTQWGSKPAPITFARCPACGPWTIYAASEAPPTTACKDCRKAMDSWTLIYSKQLRRDLMAALAGHARCTAAVKEIDGMLDNILSPEIEKRLTEALEVARVEGHQPAQEALMRVQAVRSLAFTGIMAMQVVARVSALESEGREQSLAAAHETLRRFASIADQCNRAGFPDLGIHGYEQVIKYYRKLLEKVPGNLPLRYSLAAAVDELGITLYAHEPNRRQEALSLVREAADIFEAMDREDPEHREERRKDREEVLSHLAWKW